MGRVSQLHSGIRHTVVLSMPPSSFPLQHTGTITEDNDRASAGEWRVEGGSVMMQIRAHGLPAWSPIDEKLDNPMRRGGVQGNVWVSNYDGGVDAGSAAELPPGAMPASRSRISTARKNIGRGETATALDRAPRVASAHRCGSREIAVSRRRPSTSHRRYLWLASAREWEGASVGEWSRIDLRGRVPVQLPADAASVGAVPPLANLAKMQVIPAARSEARYGLIASGNDRPTGAGLAADRRPHSSP